METKIKDSINNCSNAIKNVTNNNGYVFKETTSKTLKNKGRGKKVNEQKEIKKEKKVKVELDIDNDAGAMMMNKDRNKKKEYSQYGIPTQLGLLMESVTDFYEDPVYMEQMISIINQTHILSLRILDWFVTNYSKKYKTIIPSSEYNLDVYQMYKLQLKSLGKIRMDVFCRKNKLIFYYAKDKFIETSCGQLCFFKWCFENDILTYVKEHQQIIEEDMKESLTEKKVCMKKLLKEGGPKRKQTSINSSKSLSKYKMNYTVTF